MKTKKVKLTSTEGKTSVHQFPINLWISEPVIKRMFPGTKSVDFIGYGKI